MYFESRKNLVYDASKEAIKKQISLIKELSIGNAIQIGDIIWVNDANPSGSVINEAALLYNYNDKFYQFESVTTDWCNDLELENLIKQYSNVAYLVKEYDVLNLKEKSFNKESNLSWFDCGCCGTGFKSTLKYQKQFDQDAGYGMCRDCE